MSFRHTRRFIAQTKITVKPIFNTGRISKISYVESINLYNSVPYSDCYDYNDSG